jgi:translation initiation factor IF-1
MSNQEKDKNNTTGVVIEALPEAMFKVLTEDNEEILAYLAGKMRMHRIKVLVGDKVEMTLDPYGGKARIFKRN